MRPFESKCLRTSRCRRATNPQMQLDASAKQDNMPPGVLFAQLLHALNPVPTRADNKDCGVESEAKMSTAARSVLR